MRDGRFRKLRLALACATTLAVTLAACSKDATVPVIVQIPNYDPDVGFPDEDRRSEIQSYVLSIWDGTPGLCRNSGAVGRNQPMDDKPIAARVYPADARDFSFDNLTGGRDQFVVLEGCRQPPEEIEDDPSLCDAVYRGSSVPGDYLAPDQTEPTGKKYGTIRLFFGRVGRFNPLVANLAEGAFGATVDLGNGRFVFTGGVVGNAVSTNAYVFDRERLSFERFLANLGTNARVHATAARLSEGGALIVGGYGTLSSPVPWNFSERFDREGRLVPDGRHTMSPRAFAAAAPIKGGRVIVVGGIPGRDLLAPDQYADEWDESGANSFQMNRARSFHTATSLIDGRALFTGGLSLISFPTPGPDVADTAEIVEGGSTTTTKSVAGMLPRWAHTASLVPDGRVVVIGGASTVPVSGTSARLSLATVTSADIFSVVPDEFAEDRQAVLEIGRAHHAASTLGNGDILVSGGTRCAGVVPGFADVTTAFCGESALPLGSSEIWWRDQNRFMPGPELLIPRYGHASFHLGDGTVLVAGGIGTHGNFTQVVEIYVPTWRCSITTTTAFP